MACLMRLLIYLTSLIPLSFKGEGEIIEEGLRPSKTPLIYSISYFAVEGKPSGGGDDMLERLRPS